MPIILQTLKINNSRSTKGNSIYHRTITKLIQYNFKMCPKKALFTYAVFEVLMSDGRLLLSSGQRGTGKKMIQVSVKTQKNILNFLKLIEK